MQIKVGVCGFTKKYYEMLSVVELQKTFYNIPMDKTVQKWRKEAPEHFEFTFKAFQGLTHPYNSPTWRKYRGELRKEELKLVGNLQLNEYTKKLIHKMISIAKTLRSRIIIIQTPSRFNCSSENIEKALDFFSYFDKLLRKEKVNLFIGWEPRGNWLKNYDSLREILSNVPRLIHVTDPFFHRPVILKEIVYFRLHGKPYLNYRYQYGKKDYEALRNIIDEIGMRSYVKTIYVMFNNIKMLDNVKEFEKFIMREEK